MEPVFLNLSEVFEIHQDQIDRYGGASGIRDIGLLQSAIGMPCATYNGEFLHTDIFEMAAAYLFHLVMKLQEKEYFPNAMTLHTCIDIIDKKVYIQKLIEQL